jgi:hypothetical protein
MKRRFVRMKQRFMKMKQPFIFALFDMLKMKRLKAAANCGNVSPKQCFW